MTTYLTGGWYQPGPNKSLRTEVIDGAMDAAGMLHRAGIRPDAVAYLALKVRSMFDPHTYSDGLSEEKRASIARRLGDASGDSPELYSFLSDCLEHVEGPSDLLAFYLHLVHVSRMLQLLAAARLNIAFLSKPPPQPQKKAAPAKKKLAKKKVAKKKVAKKKVAKKKVAAKKAKPKKKPAKPKTKPKKTTSARRR